MAQHSKNNQALALSSFLSFSSSSVLLSLLTHSVLPKFAVFFSPFPFLLQPLLLFTTYGARAVLKACKADCANHEQPRGHGHRWPLFTYSALAPRGDQGGGPLLSPRNSRLTMDSEDFVSLLGQASPS